MHSITETTRPHPLITLSGSIGVATIVTFALFVLMNKLIDKPPIIERPIVQTPTIDIAHKVEETKQNEIERVLPEPPPVLEQPERITMTPDNSNDAIDFNPNVTVNIDTSANTSNAIGSGVPADANAMPIVRINPKYPIVAAREGKEGWVILSFSINELGGVEDVHVVNAEPKRIFDKEAKRALRKWKYKAKIVNGVAQKQENLTVQLDFSLDT